MTTFPQQPTVGQTVLVQLRDDADPVEGLVVKVSKRQFKVQIPGRDAPTPFSLEPRWKGKNEADSVVYGWEQVGQITSRRSGVTTCYRCDDRSHLLASVARHRAAQELKNTAERTRRIFSTVRQQQRVASVRRRLANDYATCTLWASIMPDGSRMRLLQVPTRLTDAGKAGDDRKAGWEVILLRLKNGKDFFEREEKIEAGYTYQNAGSTGFSSVSTNRYDSDDEAIWNVIADVYYSW